MSISLIKMRIALHHRALEILAVCSLLLSPSNALAVPYVIEVDTTPIAGQEAQLTLDFIEGGPPSNSATISLFSTDAILGNFSGTGGVSGTLPGSVLLTDTAFFNEYMHTLILGSNVALTLETTTNAPDSGASPDAFSLFLLNSGTSLPLFSTTDPSGADALLALDITGAAQGMLRVFSALGQEVVVTVTLPSNVIPEPGSIILLGTGLGGVAWRLARRKQSRSVGA
jgi:hypothetical protein